MAKPVSQTLCKSHEKDGIQYQYSLQARAWTFKRESFTFIRKIRGAEKAHKVANILAGSFKRSGQVDGLARKNIDKILS